MRHRAEIDVRREVGQAWKKERIDQSVMAVVSHQCARAALGVIVLGGGKPIVEEEHRSAIAALSERAQQRLRGGIDLRKVIAFPRKPRLGGVAQSAASQRAIREDELPAG